MALVNALSVKYYIWGSHVVEYDNQMVNCHAGLIGRRVTRYLAEHKARLCSLGNEGNS